MAEELGILRHIRRGYHQIIRDMVTLRERERALNLRVHVVVISVPSSGACWELSSNMVKKKLPLPLVKRVSRQLLEALNFSYIADVT